MKAHYIIPIFVPHKGCPHNCVFCNQKHITGETRETDSEFVRSEIANYRNTFKNKEAFVEVSFFGGSFTGLPLYEQVELLKPAKEALDAGTVDAIRLSTRPDYINPLILDTLKKYGVSIIELGVQSMDDSVLYLSGRGHDAKIVYDSSRLIKEWGFTLGLQMMVGLPGDNEEHDLKTADEFVAIAPSMVRIYPALVIKDTYMETMYKKGAYRPLSVDEAVLICCKLYLKFERAGINIIRIGLQPTDNIQPGRDLVAGPFHPAFRSLVESKILNDIAIYLYKGQDNKDVIIKANQVSLSKLFADRKKYFNAMLKDIDGSIKVIQDRDVPSDTLLMISGEYSICMSIKDYSFTK